MGLDPHDIWLSDDGRVFGVGGLFCSFVAAEIQSAATPRNQIIAEVLAMKFGINR